MRTKQAFTNAIFSLFLQLTLAISGLIVPRFFIAVYGSAINGLVSSISQFITYMSLVEAGVGAAGTVALYGPLADSDTKRINGILSATRSFYLRSGLIFLGLVMGLVALYPLLVNNEIQDVSFIRIMIIVLSVNGLVDYFFLGKYRVLLLADQKGYVIYGVQIIGTIIMTAVCIWQIHIGCSALLVKGTAAIIYIFRSLAVILYVKTKYPKVNFKVPPHKDAFNQRNAALLHQIVGVIANNAAVILLTVLVKKDALAEVSVYSVYNLVFYSLSSLLNAIFNGLTPSFGQVISKNEDETLKRSYSSYEFLMFLIIFICYICMAVLLYPFIKLYSTDFTDGVNYLRWELVALFSLAGILQAIRIPGLTIICAAGHYKETQSRAILELIISLVVSISLTSFLGIVGVASGLCASYLYRSFDVIVYTAKYFVKGTLKQSLLRLLRNLFVAAISILGGLYLIPQNTDSWLVWLIGAVALALASAILLVLINFIFEPKEIKNIFALAKNVLQK